MSDSIYAHVVTNWPVDPAPQSLRTSAPRSVTAATPSIAAEMHDATLLAILDAPLPEGERLYTGFARKEQELGNAFAKLSVLEQRALYGRFRNPRQGDVLAEKFSRFTIERRTRLLEFLNNARKRAAMSKAVR